MRVQAFSNSDDNVMALQGLRNDISVDNLTKVVRQTDLGRDLGNERSFGCVSDEIICITLGCRQSIS